MAIAMPGTQELNKHVKELYSFIDSNGLALSRYPRILLHHERLMLLQRIPLYPFGSAWTFAKAPPKLLQIKFEGAMSKAHGSLYDETCDARKTWITSDDLS